jgi:site-specific recombinase XerD
MSISLKIILHSKTYTDGTNPVMLQCIKSGSGEKIWKRRMICKVKPSQFDKAKGRVKNHPNALLLNAQIAEAFTEAERRLLEWQLAGRPVDPELVIAAKAVEAPKSGMLIQHGQAYIEKCRQKGMFHTAEKYGSHLTRLAEYLGKNKAGEQIDVHMDDVNEDWVLKWSVWLKSHGTKSANTLHRRMAFITTLFNDARKRRLTTSDPLAFLEFKGQKVRKPKLTLEQVGQLEMAHLEEIREHDARNTFLLQFYAYGSRISDALTWKKTDVRKEGDLWYLSYTSMKTGTLVDVRLNAKAKELVAYYLVTVPGPFLLPWLAKFEYIPSLTDQQNRERLIKQVESKTSIVNGQLKEVASKAGLEIHLTTHIARHTFATLADQVVTDKRKISAALGQARFATTEIYLAELRQDDVNDAMDVLWK